MTLQQYNEIDSRIAMMTTVAEGKEWIANGKTLHAFLKHRGFGIQEVNKMMYRILLLEHKTGKLLDGLVKHGTNRYRHSSETTLEELGVSPWDARRWRKVAKVDPEDIRIYCEENPDLATRAGLLRLHTESTTSPKKKTCPNCGYEL